MQVFPLENNERLECSVRKKINRAVLGGNGSNDDDSHALGTLMRFDAKTGKSFVLVENVLGKSFGVSSPQHCHEGQATPV